MQCKAKSKQSGERCKRHATPGKEVCVIHGGRSKAGINAPNFKHGRYSKAMPAGLLEKYQDAQNDEQLLDQRASIQVIDAMIATILPNIDSGDNGKAWQAMKKLVDDIRVAYGREDYIKLEQALREMDDWANRRIQHYESIEETRVLLDTRRKHVETEQKLSVINERAITVDQVMLLMSQILHVIQTVVTDRQQQHAIANALQGLISIPARTDGTG
jgi:hypothetical protein